MNKNISKTDLDIQWFSGTGKGGQHRNRHMNCCRVRHVPTGVQVQSTAHRERTANLKAALRMLAAKVEDHLHTDPDRYSAPDERVRTYHEPRNIVYDHASGETGTYKDVVYGNGLGELIEARRKKYLQKK